MIPCGESTVSNMRINWNSKEDRRRLHVSAVVFFLVKMAVHVILAIRAIFLLQILISLTSDLQSFSQRQIGQKQKETCKTIEFSEELSEVVNFVATTPLWVKRDAGEATPAGWFLAYVIESPFCGGFLFISARRGSNYIAVRKPSKYKEKSIPPIKCLQPVYNAFLISLHLY